ncbi:hypothetical protein DFA_02341 [Cavenderia fasciculata]|uniref:HAT C-terminal dimerisation domain-containing protein n=1 Tax=Cavenderia fasciculata TaxID=261658 RepID=F4PZ66_CACFS|nr:uncharacterized protein DFA_02341 [Cavenderia fasciculata]EGG19095.1 hypothetical protein DFA_02341 [Cavenderia fasciculata]|eukprot:XP_004366728.1 hypothetical protein DFA_02341 [Cavenderia fasciculata]
MRKQNALKYTPPSYDDITKNHIPRLAKDVRLKIDGLIARCDSLSLTMDTWANNQSIKYLGITSHFITKYEFTIESVLLGTYLAETLIDSPIQLASVITECLKEYNIVNDRVDAVVIENKISLVKGIQIAGLNPISCAVHTIQSSIKSLVVKIKSDRTLTKKLKTIIFRTGEQPIPRPPSNDTTTTTTTNTIDTNMDTIDADMDTTKNTTTMDPREAKQLMEEKIFGTRIGFGLKYYSSTRWTSLFKMVERLYTLYSLGSIQSLKDSSVVSSDIQIKIISDYISLMKPLAEVSIMLNDKENITISKIIPIFKAITFHIESVVPGTDLGKKLKTKLVESLKKRIEQLLINPLYNISMLIESEYASHRVSSQVDILNYWKLRADTYPWDPLPIIARRILSTPASSFSKQSLSNQPPPTTLSNLNFINNKILSTINQSLSHSLNLNN